MSAYFRSIRLFNRDVKMYLITSALIGFSYFGVLTVLLNLYLLRLGYGAEFIGLANGSTALAFALFSAPAGALGSRFGYRRVVIAGVCFLTFSTTVFPLAEFLPSPWAQIGVVVARLLSGLGFALYQVNSNPYLVAATTRSEREQVFSLQVAMPPVIGFMGNLAGGLMPALFARGLGETLEQPAPYRYPLLLTGLLLTPAIWALLQTREVENLAGVRDKLMRGAAPWVLIVFLAGTACLRIAGEGASRTFFTVYLDTGFNISTARIGLLTAICQVFAGGAAILTPFLTQRIGRVNTVVYATLSMAACLLVLALIPHWLGATLGFMGAIGMISVANAVTSIFQMEAVTPEWRGLTAGISAAASGMGYSSMALGGGFLISLIGYQGLFVSGAGLVFTSAVIFWLYFRTWREEPAI
jgi:MFS family permease